MTEEESCRLYCLRLLGRREYSEHELRTKTKGKGYSEEVIGKVILELQRQNFQSDERCAEAIWEQYKDTKGVRWMEQKFALRKIDTSFLYALAQDYHPKLDRLKQTVLRKYNISSFKNLDYSLYAKISGYLMRRGFSGTVLKEWISLDEGH